MQKTLNDHLYSCGKDAMPSRIDCLNQPYKLIKVLKHDFFAATALYGVEDNINTSHSPQKIILKINRDSNFYYIPMKWIGRFLAKREVGFIERLKPMPNVPRFLDHFGDTGFTYEYIEGISLDHKPQLPKTFFDDLLEITRKIHSRNVVYLDMNKRGNIILGDDSRPHIVDFQISFHIPDLPFGLAFISRSIRKALQYEDIYHIHKHKRKLQLDLLTPEECAIAKKRSMVIKVHRVLAWPFKKIRRELLRILYRKKILKPDDSIKYSPENDPAKYAR